VKEKRHKQTVKDDMRNNYIFDVMMERWKDRERKLEDEYKKFPAVNSFPMELRKPEGVDLRPRSERKPGELPSSSKNLPNNSVQALDELWPALPTLDDVAKEKVN